MPRAKAQGELSAPLPKPGSCLPSMLSAPEGTGAPREALGTNLLSNLKGEKESPRERPLTVGQGDVCVSQGHSV